MDKPNRTEWQYAIRVLQRAALNKGADAREFEELGRVRGVDLGADALRAQRDVLQKVIAYLADHEPPDEVVTTAPENFDALFALARGRDVDTRAFWTRRPCSACGELLMIGHTVCFSPKCLADTESRERAALDRLCTCEARGMRTPGTRHARACPAFTAFYCCPSCPGLQDQHSMDACYQVGRSKHGRCECGEDLEYFPGPNAGGVLCPSCDEEHVAELLDLNATVRDVCVCGHGCLEHAPWSDGFSACTTKACSCGLFRSTGAA
jgi:hypothetical protein